jgi:hypothetical protein
MKIFIYCGIPGSGKTTLIRERHPMANRAGVCSSDHHFEKVVDGETIYDFQPSGLPEAHGSCLRKFAELVRMDPVTMAQWGYDGTELIVDNTNSSIAELAPYVALGQAHKHDVKIITLRCDPEKAHRRNTHGVSLETVLGMATRIDSRDIPPWWSHEIIDIA